MTDRTEKPDVPPVPLTTMHVRRAIGGDTASLDWLVARLTPLLMAQAEYRLGPALRTSVDPEDLVNEAWVVALPRLAEFARHPRATPVLLKFLTTTIVYRINHLLRRRATSLPVDTAEALDALPARTSGVVTRAVRSEATDALRRQIDALDPHDREIIALRGVEQHPSKTVAIMLGISSAAVDQRFARALQRLRAILPDVAGELAEDRRADG